MAPRTIIVNLPKHHGLMLVPDLILWLLNNS
jgi:hypothetical protein